MACPEFLVNYVEGVTKVALNGFTGDETKREVEILRDLMVYKDFMARIDCVNFEIKGKNRYDLSIFHFKLHCTQLMCTFLFQNAAVAL